MNEQKERKRLLKRIFDEKLEKQKNELSDYANRIAELQKEAKAPKEELELNKFSLLE